MASLTNAAKSQKTHRERSQPQARAHLGILEKKKDYKARANDFHQKQDTIKALKRKALDKNPLEFYFHMVNSKIEDGVHHTVEKAPEYTDDQLKLMQSQDKNYIGFKRSLDLKKIATLENDLHLAGAVKPCNKHTVFVDSKKQAEEFDEAAYFETDESLVSRTFNRPRIELLKKETFFHNTADQKLSKTVKKEKMQKCQELLKRVQREKQLKLIMQKMEMKKHLMDKKAKKKKITDETPQAAACYKWVPERKR